MLALISFAVVAIMVAQAVNMGNKINFDEK